MISCKLHTYDCSVHFAQSMEASGVTPESDSNPTSVQSAGDGGGGGGRESFVDDGEQQQQLSPKEMEVIRSLDR